MREACPEYADALVDFSDGELFGEKRREIEEHLAACPACRAELRQLDASLGQLKSGISTVTVRIQEHAGMSSRLGWTAAIAASLLLCLAAAWWIGLRRPDSNLAKAVPPPAVETDSAPRMNSRDALWQIALFEQEARLQTSLEMLPKDETFDDQRKEDERLLAKFQAMTRDVRAGYVQ